MSFLNLKIRDKAPGKTAISIEIHNSVSLMEKDHPTPFSLQSNPVDCQLGLVKYLLDFQLKWQIYFMHQICEVACSK